MSDNHYYGCCACIGSAGNGLIPKMAMLATHDGYAMNLFISGSIKVKTQSGSVAEFDVKTDYPKSGRIDISVNADSEFTLYIRNPHWSKNTEVLVNGTPIEVCDGYIKISRLWKNGDTVELSLDMRTKAVYPVEYGHEILMNKVIWGHNYMVSTYDEQDPEAMCHIALTRGPIVLAQDSRIGYSVDEPSDIAVGDDGYVDVLMSDTDSVPYPHILEVDVPLKNGGYMTVSDYASAGKLWSEESKMAAWIKVKRQGM